MNQIEKENDISKITNFSKLCYHFAVFKQKKSGNYFQSTISKEEKIRDNKFITKKRGRKLKFLSNNNNNNNNFDEQKSHNKYSNDNVKRRIKALFHKYIISSLNYLITKKFQIFKSKFVKINSKITKNIGIEYNRNLLNKKISEIIINISNKYINKNNNKNCIEFIESQKNNEDIIKALNMTYGEMYVDFYLKSNKNNTFKDSYEEHKEKLMNEYGKQYLEKFIENAENFIDFFVSGKNRKSRKCEELKIIDIPLENDISENTTNNEIDKYCNINNFYMKNKMASTSSQTDISDINSKLIFFC